MDEVEKKTHKYFISEDFYATFEDWQVEGDACRGKLSATRER